MKRKLNILLSIVMVAALVLGGMHCLEGIMTPPSVAVCMNYVEAFHKLPSNSAEVMIYGSSHAWHGCDTRELYRKYGIAAYNYGCNWQNINTTALFLEDSFRTQSPKVVLIETVLSADVLHDVDFNGEIAYTRAIPMFKGKWEYLRQCFGNRLERYLSYAFPIVSFHENWSAEKPSEVYPLEDHQAILSRGGFPPSNKVEPIVIPDYRNFQSMQYTPQALEWLDKIVAMCKEHNAEIVFFTVPYLWEHPYIQAMEEYAAANGYPYLNLFDHLDETGIDGQTDFMDAGHLNTSGGQKMADYLGAYLKEHYDLTDYRSDPDSLWSQMMSAAE